MSNKILSQRYLFILSHARIGFLILGISFLFGCFLGSIAGGFHILILSTILLFGGYLIIRFPLWFIGITFIIVGFLYGDIGYKEHVIKEEFLRVTSGNYSRTIPLSGKIIGEERQDGRYTIYRLDIDKIDTISPPVSTHIWIRIPSNLTVEKNDTLSWTGKLYPIAARSDSSYRFYGLIQGVYGRSNLYTFSRKSYGSPQGFTMEMIRKSFLSTVRKIYPGDSGGLMAGILIGNTSFISEKTIENFRATGLSHLLAVSGSNVAFLLIIIEKIIRYFPLRKYIRITLIGSGLIFFMLLVGLDVPVIRATCMGLLIYMGFSFDRKVESVSLLLLVMIGFCIYEPLFVLYDIGFMLSCLATLSILIWKDRLLHFLRWIPDRFLLRESAVISVAATVGTLPYTLYTFETTPIFGILSNILIGPIVGWIMAFGLLSIMLGYMSHWFAYIAGYPAYLLIKYMLIIAGNMGLIEPGFTAMISPILGLILSLFLVYVVLEMFVFISGRMIQNQKDGESQDFLLPQENLRQ